MRKHIPQELIEQYRKRQITSAALADIVGVHPVTIRKNIKCDPAGTPKTAIKPNIIRVRRLWRLTLANLPAREIAKQAGVSLRTAYRIKQKAKDA